MHEIKAFLWSLVAFHLFFATADRDLVWMWVLSHMLRPSMHLEVKVHCKNMCSTVQWLLHKWGRGHQLRTLFRGVCAWSSVYPVTQAKQQIELWVQKPCSRQKSSMELWGADQSTPCRLDLDCSCYFVSMGTICFFHYRSCIGPNFLLGGG